MPGTGRSPRRARLATLLSRDERRRLGGMFGVIVLLHVVGAGLLLAAVNGHYELTASGSFGIGTGFLAYSLGMRHAFDADHIAAIDNTTRKLMGEGRRPMGVGFFFSLGHSSVVFVLTVLLGLGIKAVGTGLSDESSGLHRYGGLVGTSVSGGVSLPHRAAQRHRARRDREGLRGDAPRGVRRRRSSSSNCSSAAC